MLGRPPKPTRLKMLEGNRGKRPINNTEPQPVNGPPPCPRWLGRDAKREWRRVCRELAAMGLLARADMTALAGRCQEWARYVEMQHVLAEKGCTFETATGGFQARPEVAIADKALGRVNAIDQQLGLTPAARSRLSTQEKPQDDLEAMLGG